MILLFKGPLTDLNKTLNLVEPQLPHLKRRIITRSFNPLEMIKVHLSPNYLLLFLTVSKTTRNACIPTMPLTHNLTGLGGKIFCVSVMENWAPLPGTAQTNIVSYHKHEITPIPVELISLVRIPTVFILDKSYFQNKTSLLLFQTQS